ncbi:hypothetical protein B0J18DRAFT_410980 [Chaetomium sp. MPI-SDFR-AT-0129]|nr:hypothetical protein B0J18DRAFT_410980 [Chaetomium sp. MPI-SDFR-AT-0129]
MDQNEDSGNHHQAQLEFIDELLRTRFQVSVGRTNIKRVQDSPKAFPRPEVLTYQISLDTPITTTNDGTNQINSLQPGCVAIPKGTEVFVVRLIKPGGERIRVKQNNSIVENEVAIMSLASAALQKSAPNIVPRVYAWGSAAVKTDQPESSSQGWILLESISGRRLADVYDDMGPGQKRSLFTQVSVLLKSFQTFTLPAGITRFGQVTYEDDGQIVSKETGSWPSYEAYFRGRLEAALREADHNEHIKGWVDDGLRERLGNFVTQGLSAHFEELGSKEEKVVTHAAINPDNILFDPESGQIIGLTGYESACILHPSYEFFRTLSGLSDHEVADEREGGNATGASATTEDSRAFRDILRAADIKHPQSIEGFGKVAKVDAVLQAIRPLSLVDTKTLELQTREAIMQSRDEKKKSLSKLLDRLGY